MSSLPVGSGRYFLYSENGTKDPIGNGEGPLPHTKPIVRLSRRAIWLVEDGDDDGSILSVGVNVPTLPDGNYVLSNDNPGVKGTKWIVTTNEAKHGLYTILDPKSKKGWTLKPGEKRVSLEPVPRKDIDIKPPQLWKFVPYFHPREEEGGDEDEDDSEDEGEEV